MNTLPPGTISQNVPDKRPEPYESDTYNKGGDKPKRKQKPIDDAYNPFFIRDRIYGKDRDDFMYATLVMCVILLVSAILIGLYLTPPKQHPCDKYAALTIKEVPAQCVRYFLED